MRDPLERRVERHAATVVVSVQSPGPNTPTAPPASARSHRSAAGVAGGASPAGRSEREAGEDGDERDGAARASCTLEELSVHAGPTPASSLPNDSRTRESNSTGSVPFASAYWRRWSRRSARSSACRFPDPTSREPLEIPDVPLAGAAHRHAHDPRRRGTAGGGVGAAAPAEAAGRGDRRAVRHGHRFWFWFWLGLGLWLRFWLWRRFRFWFWLGLRLWRGFWFGLRLGLAAPVPAQARRPRAAVGARVPAPGHAPPRAPARRPVARARKASSRRRRNDGLRRGSGASAAGGGSPARASVQARRPRVRARVPARRGDGTGAGWTIVSAIHGRCGGCTTTGGDSATAGADRRPARTASGRRPTGRLSRCQASTRSRTRRARRR